MKRSHNDAPNMLSEIDINETISDPIVLVKNIVTTSMFTDKSECLFSTLKRTKIFLRNTVNEASCNDFCE